MNIDLAKASSRPDGVAELLLQCKVDGQTAYSKSVVLMGDVTALRTRNGRWCFLDATRLLSCVVGNLTIVIPEGVDNLMSDTQTICSHAWSRGERRLLSGSQPEALRAAAVILHVGLEVNSAYPSVAISAEGWVARVSTTPGRMSGSFDAPNPMAALMAASLGVTEVFKRIIGVREDVIPRIERAEFSLYDFSTTPRSVGPHLPESMSVPSTVLTGAGALGNGIALLFSQLPVNGRVRIVDKQHYGEENFGTCVLLGRQGWLDQAKAERLAAWLAAHSSLTVSGEKETIDNAISAGSLSGVTVDLVLNGLDDVQARRDSQRLWPTVIIDGAINAVGAAVTQHRLAREDLACLLCWFDLPVVDDKQYQAAVTGLDLRSLGDLSRQITERDIQMAAPEKREWLRECRRQAKTICSTFTEAEMKLRLGVDAEASFRPSVPFVATASAALVISEAVKALYFPDAQVTSQFQLGNLFLGPQASALVRRAPSPTCRCKTQRRLVQRLRSSGTA